MSETGEADQGPQGDVAEADSVQHALDPSLTCFILLAKFLGTPADPAQMIHDRGRGEEPWSVEDFARISKRLGLISKIRSTHLVDLAKLPLPALADGVPLHALHAAGARADGNRLRVWAEAHDGQMIAIDPAAPQRAVDALLHEPPRLLQVELSGGDDWIAQGDVVRDGMLRVAGRLVGEKGRLRLRWRDADGSVRQDRGKDKVFSV